MNYPKKTTFTLILVLLVLFSFSIIGYTQTRPTFNLSQGPTLLANGAADEQIGAKYIFENVEVSADGMLIDAIITIVDKVNLDEPNASSFIVDSPLGVDDRFEPTINTGAGDGYVEWKIEFVLADSVTDATDAGVLARLNEFTIEAIDVDGFEYFEIVVTDSYTLEGPGATNPTDLVVSQNGIWTRFQSDADFAAGIDVANTQFNVSSTYRNISSVSFRNGSSNDSTNRQNSISFLGEITFEDENTVIVNNPPVVIDNVGNIVQLNTSFSANVLIGSSDPDDPNPDLDIDPATVLLIDPNNPANQGSVGSPLVIPGVGTYTVSNTGDVVFTPITGYSGDASILFSVEDDLGVLSNQANLGIIINGVPLADNDTATVNQDSSATSIDVLDGDTFGGDGPNIGTITLPSPTSTNGGIVTVDDNGTPNDPTDDQILYSPAVGFAGTDTFTYTITDANGDPSTATVTITVDPNPCDPITSGNLDTDNDGISDTCDLDDDNDGILDTNEGCAISKTADNANFSINKSSFATPLNTGANGFGVDILRLDNSFNITVNGSPLFSQELNFAPIFNVNPFTVKFADGDQHGTNMPQIWQMGTANAATPLIRLIVSADGSVEIFGSKTLNGPLEPMIFINGTTVNPVSWNAITNTIIVDQFINGQTYAVGSVYGYITECQDTDGDGTPDSLDNDSDNDGCPDVLEASATILPTAVDANGQLTGAIDPVTGVPNNVDVNVGQANSASVITATQVIVDASPLVDKTVISSSSTTFNISVSALNTTTFLGTAPNTTPNYAAGSNSDAGLNYEWYIGDPDNTGTLIDGTDGNYTAFDTATLNIVDITGLNNTTYYVVITHDDNECVKETNNATLSVFDVVDDVDTTNEDTPVVIDVLANDNDLPTTGTITTTQPTNGTVVVTDPNGTPNDPSDDVVTYTPNPDFNGTDTFEYTVCDANNVCDTAEVVITINPIVDVVDDVDTTDENTPVIIDVLANDNDVPTTGTITVTQPTNGTVVITDPNGTPNDPSDDVITYTPNLNYDGTDTFTYTICDANGNCDTADVVVTILQILSSIGDTVWYDTDEDGIKDAGESGLAGATVTLDPGTQNDPSDDITIITDANGNYLFDNLPAGDYIVTVDVSTVTSGLPAGKTVADLVQIFDADGLGSPSKSYLTLVERINNLDQDFAFVVPSGGVTGGHGGGVESESLGDAISKIYVGRKKNSEPTEFVKSSKNLYIKSKMKSIQPYQGKGQTLLDMFPTGLYAGNVANITSPTDILDYTVADEVLSVDFSLNGETKGVVLGIKTTDKIYNHTKASCDRLRGAEILNIQTIQIKGYNFLMQGIKQRNGVVEYAISFATAKNNNDSKYTIQTNWYVNNYTKFNDVYNFQVWSTRPADTQKLVADVLDNLQSSIPVNQVEVQKIPETYASKIYREKGELIVQLRSTEVGKTAEVSMVELYSETANNIKHRNNAVTTEIQQALRLDIADGYEYDALVKVDGEVEDAFYHADGNWGLDYDKRYTEINKYFVWNDFDREYQDDEYTINRNVEIKATSDYDYLTVYKSLLPGTISADYSEYNYVAFTAKGSGLMELGLIKSSIEDWKAQYRVMVDLSEEEQTYYVPFDVFSSSATQNKLTAEDLTTLIFTFLPVEAQTTELDLTISDVKFTKTAVEDQIINKIEKFENEFIAYPNPSKGNVNLLLFSETDTEATVTLSDITGKIIYRGKAQLNAGKNELDFNFKVKTGVMLLQVTSPETDYGTSKIIFR